MQLQLLVRAPQRRQHARQQEGRDRGNRAEAQKPGQGPRRGAGGFRQVGRGGQQVAGARGDFLAHRRQAHVALVALDELHAQQRLELLEPRRERGLRDELRFGGDAEVQALGELDQIGELAQGGQWGHQAPLSA